MDRLGRRSLGDRSQEPAQQQPAPAPAMPLGISNHALAALVARDATKEKPKKAPVTGHRVEFPSIGAVPIESMQWSPGRGQDQPTDITFTSKVGDHSSDLMREALQGTAQDVEVIYGPLKLKLKGAIVSSYQTGSGGEKEPLESWTLNVQGVEYEHEGSKQQDDAPRAPGYDLTYPG